MAKSISRLKPRPNGSLVVTIRLTLMPGRDDDLIAALESAPSGALAGIVREMMRSGAMGNIATEAVIHEPEPDLSGMGFDL
jgi:hypothetical protein